MNIYSYEFSNKTVKYEISKYNEKNFFGTPSRQFFANRSMLLLDVENDFIINPSTFYKPIIRTEFQHMVSVNTFTYNADLITGNYDVNESDPMSSSDEDLAIILIDDDTYRLVDYMIRRKIDPDDTAVNIVRIFKGKTTKVAMISVNHSLHYGALVCTMILYNRLRKRYEYVTIRRVEGGLSCDDLTDQMQTTLESWKDFDEKNKKAGTWFKVSIPWPVGKFYATTSEYKNELENLLLDYNTVYKPVITVVNKDQNASIKIIKDTFHGKRLGLTWYRTQPFHCITKDYPIECNLIMDETGVVMGE